LSSITTFANKTNSLEASNISIATYSTMFKNWNCWKLRYPPNPALKPHSASLSIP
jgi:hypothetical protein